MNNSFLKDIVGQEKVKQKLLVHSSSYKQNGILEPTIWIGARGTGKTRMVREFRKSLKRPDGTTPKIIEVNGATVKSHLDFFEQIWPVWQAERAFLFFDEAHNLPDKLLEIFLTLLEKDNNLFVREVTINHKDIGPILYSLDIRSMHIAFGTTDHNTLPEALLDRLTEICLERYSNEQLMSIFLDKIKEEIIVEEKVKQEIPKVFRGHPRDAVAKAEELIKFSLAKGKKNISVNCWRDYCSAMGVYPLGLNETEINILKILEERRSVSLTGLSAATGCSPGVIRQKYEKSLLSKGLMDINGQRIITQKGRNYLKELA